MNTLYVWSIIGERFIFKLKEHAHMRSCNVLHLLMCYTKHFSFFDCAGSLQDLLAVTAACRTFGCGMWDIVLQLGAPGWAPALGTQSLSPWTTSVSLVAQSCPTLCNPMDCSPPGSSVHGISQARILEWVAIPFFRGYSWPRDQTCVSFIAGGFFTSAPPGETLKMLCTTSHYLQGRQETGSVGT